MKLSCPAVQDMYILYLDDELSPEVRSEIEAHLEQCSECSKRYGGSKSLKEVLGSLDEKEPSKLQDESWLPKVSLRFLKSRLVLGLVIIALMVLNTVQYNQVRGFLFREADSIVHAIEFSPKDQRLSEIQTGLRTMSIYFSSREARHLDHYEFALRELEAFEWMMDLRRERGFSEADELAWSSYESALRGIQTVLGNGSHSYFNRGITQPLVRLDVQMLSDAINFAREQASSYFLYNKGVVDASISVAEEGLRQFPGFEVVKVLGRENRIWGNLPKAGRYSFQVFEGNKVIYEGKVNGFTGLVEELVVTDFNHRDTVSEHEISQNLEDMLAPLDWELAVDYLGQSDNTALEPGVFLHTYQITPIVEGWPYTEGSLRIYFLPDGRLAGILPDVYKDPGSRMRLSPIIWPTTIDPQVNLSPEDVMEQWKAESADWQSNNFSGTGKDRFGFVETTIIRSVISGEYELVHAFRLNDGTGRDYSEAWVFFNTKTGQREIPVWWNERGNYFRR